jgi:membrane protein
MRLLSKSALHVMQHPFAFAWQVITGFNKNQGVLLAGAVAHYALLSMVPLLIVAVIVLSHIVPQDELLVTLGHYLEWLVPSQSKSLLNDISGFLDSGVGTGVVLSVTLLFFSSLAFSTLEKAMAVIFAHRRAVHKRHALVSAVLPYCFMLSLAIGLLVVTVISVGLQIVAQETVHAFGRDWSLRGVSGGLLYLLGLGVEIFIYTTTYIILPVGSTHWRHALVGGVTAAVLWEGIRHALVWYFTHLSRVSIVYGSLTTAVVALFSMEIAALLLLFGAQVIAEYERVGQE